MLCGYTQIAAVRGTPAASVFRIEKLHCGGASCTPQVSPKRSFLAVRPHGHSSEYRIRHYSFESAVFHAFYCKTQQFI